MKLDDLPSEIIASALQYASFATVSLWKCGNLRLNSKIVAGVTEISLLDTDWTSTSRWPKMLVSLTKLQRLEINRGDGALMPSHMALAEHIGSLSPGLKALVLESKEAILSLFLRPPPKVHHSAYEAVTLSFDESCMLPLEKLFPRLETLSVGRKCSVDATVHFYSVGIPSTLTELHTSSFPGNMGVGFGGLPRGLIAWSTRAQGQRIASSSVLDDYSLLPPSLTTMIEIPRILLVAGMVTALLPRSLTGEIRLPHFHPKIALQLPQGLTSLHLEFVNLPHFAAVGTIWTAALPRGLKSLFFDITEHEPNIRELRHLPQTIEKLRISEDCILQDIATYCMRRPEFNFRLLWPQNLRSLKLNGHIMSIDLFQYLPPNIKDLGIKIAPPAEFEGSYLPRQLKSLCLRFEKANAPQQWTMTLGGGFPDTLSSLEIRGDASALLSPSSLPASLTRCSFDFGGYELDEDSLRTAQWPKSLRDLTLHRWPLQSLEMLPHTLERLSIRTLGSTEVDKGNGLYSLPDSVSVLSPNLEELSIYSVSDGMFGSRTKDSKSIPLCEWTFSRFSLLQKLLLPHELLFPSEALRSLPLSLRSLRMAVPKLDVADIDFLPPRLSYCDFATESSIPPRLLALKARSLEPYQRQNYPELCEPLMARNLEFPDPRAVIHLTKNE